MPLAFFLVLLVCSAFSHHSSADDGMRAKINGMMNIYMNHFSLNNSTRVGGGQGQPSRACLQAYESLYTAPSLSIAVAMGYDDQRPGALVIDGFVAETFKSLITRPCSGSLGLCGFTPTPTNPSRLFAKTVLGPDGLDRTVSLRLIPASIGTNDDENRLRPDQWHQSALSWQEFLNATRTSDVVFYIGHSRYGSGPDFDPPRLAAAMQTDTAWYHQHLSRFSLVLDQLRQRQRERPPIIGLFSCSSGPYFHQQIREALPSAAIIDTSRDTAAQEDWSTLLGSLNALLTLQCEEGFQDALDSPGGSWPRSHFLEGFFRDGP